MTTSCSPLRYIVKSLPPSAAIAEKPSPKSRCHKRRGPVAGHEGASPVTEDLKLRCGPPHCGQSADCASATSDGRDKNASSSQAAPRSPLACAQCRRFMLTPPSRTIHYCGLLVCGLSKSAWSTLPLMVIASIVDDCSFHG